MASVVSSILKLSFGLFVEKLRDYTAKKLNDKDFTDDEIRQVIVRDLDDIKCKLDGLARKDLLSSICSFKEGIRLLYLSLGKLIGSTESKDDSLSNEESGRPKLTMKDVEIDSSDRGMTSDSYAAGEMREVDLTVAIKRLDPRSRRRFEEARSLFQEAQREAKRAFSNESLSTEDRILAIKLRVMSRVLESLEDPEAAAVSCKVYLEDLHAMSAVCEMFSVHFSGGVKSWFNKEKRTKNVTSVAIVNHVIFNLTQAFASDIIKLADWPRIKLPEKSLHPIANLGIKAIVNQHETPIFEIRSFPLSDPISRDGPSIWALESASEFGFSPHENNTVVAVTTKNEFVVTEPGNRTDDRIKMFKSDGELKLSFFINEDDVAQKKLIFKPQGLTVDGNDNIYVVATDKYHCLVHMLFVFDKCGRKIKEFLTEEAFYVAVNKECDKAFIPRSCTDNWRLSDRLYVYNISLGKVERSFDYNQAEVLTGAIAVSDSGYIFIADQLKHNLHVYTETGQPVRQFSIPPGMSNILFNSLSQEMIICSSQKDNTLLLSSYSESGHLLGALPLAKRFTPLPASSVTPDGRVVLVHGGEVYLI